MTWTFVYRKFVTGGLEVAILRICNFLKKKGIQTVLVVEDISEQMKKNLGETEIDIRYVDAWNEKGLDDKIPQNDSTIITFGLSLYFLISHIRPECKTYLYCVHPFHLTMEDRAKNFQNKIKEPIFKWIIKRGTKFNNILYMDQSMVDAVEKKYRITISPDKIYPLPFEMTDKRKEWGNDPEVREVLSICRADFPFKSYILGLIDCIKKINEQNKRAKLRIVSYGKDIDQIKRRIGDCESIELIGETPYDKLTEYYLQADIFVGMGTTILDAAKFGLPAIYANVDSPEFVSCGFFHDNPQAVGILDKEGFQGELLVKELVEQDYSELKKLGDMNREIFIQNYSMDSFYKKLQEQEYIRDNSIEKKLIYTMIHGFLGL